MNSTFSLLKACIFIVAFSLSFQSSGQNKSFKELEADAQEYFNAQEYLQALPIYLKLDSLKANNPTISARIGISYLHTEFKYKALPYLEEAIQGKYSKDFIDYYVGHAYHLDHQFDKAISYYAKSKSQQDSKNPEDQARIKRINRYIEMCNSGKELVKTPVNVKIENLGGKINSPFPEYAPVISADETVLIFTSRRPNTTGGQKDEQGQFYEDIYMSTKEDGQWGEPQSIGSSINTKGHDASIGLSADAQELLIYKHEGAGDIYYSNLNGSNWSAPKKMSGNVNTPQSWEPSASISADERILFFSSDRPGGYGGRDIYVTQKMANNEWELPRNLGPKINTVYDEDAPFIHADGTTLYFSSKGHNSMGGFDIFTVQYNPKNDTLTGAINIGYPINTAADDIFFVWSADGSRAYFSSMRANENYGEKDLYLLTRPKSHVALMVLKGKIFSKVNQKAIGATITVTDNETNKVVGVFNSNSNNGKYTVLVPPGKNYGISVEAEKHLTYSENVLMPDKDNYFEITKDILLEPLEKGSITVLKNVFFDFGKAELRKESYTELDKFYKVLQENPAMCVEIAGHTDNVGNDNDNRILSQKRALSVTKYLQTKGIDPKRLCAIGYGENYNIASNNTEPGRQQNRRIEIIVIEAMAAGQKLKECKGYYFSKGSPFVEKNIDTSDTEVTRLDVKNLPNIQFEFNSFTLENFYTKDLDLWAKFLLKNKNTKVEIGGHTDGVGSGEYNKVLAEKRVSSVKEYLISGGISPNRLTTVSYGKSKPIASNDTEEGRKKNRRVEITILR